MSAVFFAGVPSAGPGYGRIMAILSPPPAGSGEWPLWFLLRRNEVWSMGCGGTTSPCELESEPGVCVSVGFGGGARGHLPHPTEVNEGGGQGCQNHSEG